MRGKKEKVQSKVMHAQHNFKTSENKSNHGILFDEALKFKKMYSVSSNSEGEIYENDTESSSSSEYDEYAREDATSSEENRQSNSDHNDFTDSDSYRSYKKVLLSNIKYVALEELVFLNNYQEGNNATEESQLSNSDNVRPSDFDSVDTYDEIFWPPVEIESIHTGNIDPVDKLEREESHLKDLHNKSKRKSREKHLAKWHMQEVKNVESDNKPEVVQKHPKSSKSQGFFDRRQTKYHQEYHEVRNNFNNG